MKIPEALQIIGRTYVLQQNNTVYTKDDSYSQTHPGLQIIEASDRTKTDVAQEKWELDYIHEVQHLVYNALGYPADYDDEEKVTRFSEVWYQIIKQIVGANTKELIDRVKQLENDLAKIKRSKK